jgi:hypothetical protein
MDAVRRCYIADALNKPLPAPDVIMAEIEALSQWVTDSAGDRRK